MSTIRFCKSCLEWTKWTYEKNINHSRCSICGGSFSLSKKSKIQQIVDLEYNKKFKELNEWKNRVLKKHLEG